MQSLLSSIFTPRRGSSCDIPSKEAAVIPTGTVTASIVGVGGGGGKSTDNLRNHSASRMGTKHGKSRTVPTPSSTMTSGIHHKRPHQNSPTPTVTTKRPSSRPAMAEEDIPDSLPSKAPRRPTSRPSTRTKADSKASVAHRQSETSQAPITTPATPQPPAPRMTDRPDAAHDDGPELPPTTTSVSKRRRPLQEIGKNDREKEIASVGRKGKGTRADVQAQSGADKEMDTAPTGLAAQVTAEEDEAAAVFSFKTLVHHRWCGNSIEILVKWVAGDVTWESEACLHEDAPEALFDYWEEQGGRPENPNDAGLYDVHRIRSHSADRKKLLVEWVGYHPKEATWVTRTSLQRTVPDVVAQYFQSVGPSRRSGRPSKKKRRSAK
ncbi:hypothetical protein DCS_04381 [Drechmeria coniospora]|uniref:Chromo domain-containing protein n=1 Tax=Drechmeria coniospora TaxID=98403 RepID=A0A151GK35_DRECN|nr:hypothetical protein DCS_04381 [Drechmeria coniospora]KYK57372.1 hypothetical protein DCS_04381 [Drechmeria coniospora]ODA79270.1 hypothetical protein RJ55_04863 [Drechmeria coniospora]